MIQTNQIKSNYHIATDKVNTFHLFHNIGVSAHRSSNSVLDITSSSSLSAWQQVPRGPRGPTFRMRPKMMSIGAATGTEGKTDRLNEEAMRMHEICQNIL